MLKMIYFLKKSNLINEFVMFNYYFEEITKFSLIFHYTNYFVRNDFKKSEKISKYATIEAK